MIVLNDINSQIALAQEWTWHENAMKFHLPEFGPNVFFTHWQDPEGYPARVPNYMGTLEGVSRLLWELGPQWAWGPWYGGWNNQPNVWTCFEKNHQVLDEGREPHRFFSSKDRPGDCVGRAWLSVFGKDSEC